MEGPVNKSLLINPKQEIVIAINDKNYEWWKHNKNTEIPKEFIME